MKQRLKKDGTPRKAIKQFARKKPDPCCLHDWRLVDPSSVPICIKCRGQTMHGEWLHTRAIVEARMKSDRGTLVVRADAYWRD